MTHLLVGCCGVVVGCFVGDDIDNFLPFFPVHILVGNMGVFWYLIVCVVGTHETLLFEFLVLNLPPVGCCKQEGDDGLFEDPE
ncbi:hypothetical protein HanIR_Chr10g0485441 [Helianthus annuus]|nr:hypothetical protein HanIR_Chr10g0485441 [Helianthus annuus]